MALRAPEMYFWPAKSRKRLELLRCKHVSDRVLKCGSDINEGKWLQLFFCFYVLVGIVTAVIGISFFFSRVLCFTLMFSSIALWQKRLQLDFKNDLTTNGLILGFFCWEIAFFVDFISVWTEICKNCFFSFLFWRHHNFSIFSLRGILVCSLEKLVLFSHMIL